MNGDPTRDIESLGDDIVARIGAAVDEPAL
jgi:hypothetical protein